MAGQVAAVIQYASPELAGRAIAKLANGPGAAYGFMIDSHGDAAALDKALLGLAAMRGEALMHDPAVRPAGKIVEGIPGRIELMVTKADLKAVIDAREAFSQTRSNYDTASLVSPVAGVVGHLAGSVRADEWERTGGTMHRTGKVLKAFEAINRLHAEFGNGTYRKLELDVPSAVTSVSYSADPEQAKAVLLKAVSLSDVRRQEVEAARSMARAPQSRSGARSAAGMG